MYGPPRKLSSLTKYYFNKFPCCYQTELYHTCSRNDQIGFIVEKGVSYSEIIKEISSDEAKVFPQIFESILKYDEKLFFELILNDRRRSFYCRLTELLFYLEPKRWISSLLHNAFFLDLIRLGKYDAKDLLKLPMSIEHATAITRKIKNNFSFKDNLQPYFYDFGRQTNSYMCNELLLLLKEILLFAEWAIGRGHLIQAAVKKEINLLNEYIIELETKSQKKPKPTRKAEAPRNIQFYAGQKKSSALSAFAEKKI